MKIRTIIFLIVILLIWIIYSFPIQKYIGERNFLLYINEQGTNVNNILSKRALNDYINGGYTIIVIYKDDPEHKYIYSYSTKRKDDKYKIFCSIYNEKAQEVGITGEPVKYPPLIKLKENQ